MWTHVTDGTPWHYEYNTGFVYQPGILRKLSDIFPSRFMDVARFKAKWMKTVVSCGFLFKEGSLNILIGDGTKEPK